MSKKFYFLFLLNAFSLFATENALPPIIDFGRFPTMDSASYLSAGSNNDAFNLGGCAFNLAPEITPIFAFLKREYGINTVVETGTFQAYSTILFAFLFDEVHTIEFNKEYFENSKIALQNYSNVRCHFGSSEQTLKELLPSLKEKPILFYLDAHWLSFWPLLDELVEIGKTHKDNCIIVIDDFKVPGRRDIPYDAYGSHECSFEYIQDKLNTVFSSYTYHYLIPQSINSRAKFIAIPKKLKEKSAKRI